MCGLETLVLSEEQIGSLSATVSIFAAVTWNRLGPENC
jgi:hypothetical protein